MYGGILLCLDAPLLFYIANINLVGALLKSITNYNYYPISTNTTTTSYY